MRTAHWSSAVSVLDRVSAVFDAFGEHDEGLGISEIARRVNLPKSTVSRIAADLVEQRFLDRDGDVFSLGVRLFELGQTVDRPRELRRFAHPVMAELHQVTGRSVQLAIIDGSDVVFLSILRSEPAHRPAARVGGRLPAHATAVGKALLAFSSPDVVDRVLSRPLQACTPHTITDPSALRSELRQVRGAGVASEADECVVGRSCAASPVLAGDHAPIAAISVSGPTGVVTPDRVSQDVRAAAAMLSRRLADVRPA